ncbi:MAG: NTP transferase domain-containing protein [Acidobacteria bacterium]|nr:NTP transferase domain-containing protein [Acidobacteriota bacterium]
MQKAVILAAGRGTRMGALTEDLPKPMLPIRGRPMLERKLDRLREAGFDQAFLVIGYRGEVIQEHFQGYPMDLTFHRQEQVDGTGSATLLAREFAGRDPFLLTYGDIYMDAADYRGIYATLLSDPEAAAAAGARWVDDPWQGAAVYAENGRVVRILEKPPQGTSTTHWNSAGLYAFRPEVFGFLERIGKSPRGEYEITSAVDQMIAAGRKLLLYAVQGPWRDVGRPEDLEIVQELL